MKNAIVTGSSKGLGKAIAAALSEQGYDVWLSARSMDDLKQLKKELQGKFANQVHIHAVDFSDSDATVKYAQTLLQECSSIDVLVNNAGIFIPDELTMEGSLDLQMKVNFQTAYSITQTLLPTFVENKGGHIFNVCSVVNRKPRTNAASYTISKFALYGYHKVLHQTMLEHGVKVCAFFPSSINTSSWDGMDAPKDEFVQPEDIASMLVNILGMSKGTVPSEIDLASINSDF
ncbi:MAG: SDR family NAD(P)-dependent oxidoreductase [Flavobacteriales bacterium]